jgi:hypothetical protein
MKANSLIGKTMLHDELGKVKVLSLVQGSRTKVNIKVVQKAKGWDEQAQAYKRVRTVRPNLTEEGKEVGKSLHWKTYNDSHSQYGHEDECHINKLR